VKENTTTFFKKNEKRYVRFFLQQIKRQTKKAPNGAVASGGWGLAPRERARAREHAADAIMRQTVAHSECPPKNAICRALQSLATYRTA
jgi:hypothetical protein